MGQVGKAGEARWYPGTKDADVAPPSGSGPVPTDAPRLDAADEAHLVDAAQGGDPEALAMLLRAFQRRVFAVCHRMVGHPDDAADLTQDTLIKVMENLPRYDRRSAFSTWVIRIAMNASISALRKRKVRRHASLEDDSGGGGRLASRLEGQREPADRQGVEHDETTATLLAALDALDPQMKAVLVLRDMQGLEYQHIGLVLDIPVGTVKSRLFRARAGLRAMVDGLDEGTRTTDDGGT